MSLAVSLLQDAPDLMNQSELAKHLKKDRTTIYRWSKGPKAWLPVQYVGGCQVFVRTEVMLAITSHSVRG